MKRVDICELNAGDIVFFWSGPSLLLEISPGGMYSSGARSILYLNSEGVVVSGYVVASNFGHGGVDAA